MKMITRNATVAVVALSLAAASVSQATPQLRITDGVNTVIVSDNGAGDTAAALGQVNYANPTFFGWNILVSSGVTKPINGTATSPALDLTYQISRGQGSAGTLTVCFSENGFNLNPAGNFALAGGGTLGFQGAPSIVVRSFYDLNNVELAQATLLTTHTYSGQGAFGGNDTGGPVGPDPSVSFTIKIDLSEPIGGVASGDIDLHLSVPEGGSMVTFLGTGLLALGIFAARRKSARA